MTDATPTPMPDDLPMLDPLPEPTPTREPQDGPELIPPIAICRQECEESTAAPVAPPDSGRELADTGADPVSIILVGALLTIVGTIAIATRKVCRS